MSRCSTRSLLSSGSIYVMDRGYVDFARLHRIHQTGSFFVTRAKSNMAFYVSESRPVDKNIGLRCDQSIGLKTAKSKRDYSEKLRRIRYLDTESGQNLVFITNHFGLAAMTIARIYQSRTSGPRGPNPARCRLLTGAGWKASEDEFGGWSICKTSSFEKK